MKLENGFLLYETAGAAFRFRLSSQPKNIIENETGLQMDIGGLHCTVGIDEIEVHADMSFSGSISFPFTLVTEPGDTLLLPVDEGIAIPVEDKAEYVEAEEIPFYGREGTMAMLGVLRGGVCLIGGAQDGQDMGYRLDRSGELLTAEFRILSEKGHFSYPRRLRLLSGNGIAGACRAYREYRGRHITLTEKAKKNPNIDRLRGAADIWVWNDRYEELMYGNGVSDADPGAGDAMVDTARKMKQAGIQDAIFGIFFQKDGWAAREITKLGYMTAKYDNYNDVLPEKDMPYIPANRVEACDYTVRRVREYPDNILTYEDGSLAPAWALPGTDGRWHEQKTMCPTLIPQRIRDEVPGEEAKAPCEVRFVDVLGTSMAECWSNFHPLTRTDCLRAKREAFQALRDMGLISATEDGSEALADELDYTEGLHSPVFYRYQWRNCGRTKARQYGEECKDFQRRMMLDPARRVPLWELVYHDCVVAFPYWGDSTGCVEENLGYKEAFCMLYACPPLFSFFEKDRDRLWDAMIKSLKRIRQVTEKAGFSDMTDFAYLSEDRKVQKTEFSCGVTVVANFSEEPFSFRGREVKPGKAEMFETVPEGERRNAV